MSAPAASAKATTLQSSPLTTGPPPVRRLGHVRGFEGLRGIAVIIVVVAHLNIIVPMPRYLVVPGGVVSLNSFFVLSGFLITSLLLKEQSASGRINVPTFYRRRALRLLPALLVVLAAHSVYAAAANLPADIQLKSVLAAAFYFMNWRLALTGGDMGSTEVTEGLQHIWSLSFEEQFYLIWPLVTMFGLTYARRLRTVVIVVVGLMVVVSLHRAHMYWSGASWYPIFIRTDTRFDSFLPGVLLAHLWFRRREYHKRIPLMGSIAAIFLLVCLPLARIEAPFLYYGGMTLIDVSCALLILAILDGRWRAKRLFEFEPLVRLGTVSYGLYLWHLPVMFAFARWGDGLATWVSVSGALVVSLVLTLLSWFILEKPALMWKRQMEGRPVDGLSPDGPEASSPRPGPTVPSGAQAAGPPRSTVTAGAGSSAFDRRGNAPKTKPVVREQVQVGGPPGSSAFAVREKVVASPRREVSPVGGPGSPSQFSRRASRTPQD